MEAAYFNLSKLLNLLNRDEITNGQQMMPSADAKMKCEGDEDKPMIC